MRVKDPFYGCVSSLSLAYLSASCRPTFFFSTHMVMNVICYIYLATYGQICEVV